MAKTGSKVPLSSLYASIPCQRKKGFVVCQIQNAENKSLVDETNNELDLIQVAFHKFHTDDNLSPDSAKNIWISLKGYTMMKFKHARQRNDHIESIHIMEGFAKLFNDDEMKAIKEASTYFDFIAANANNGTLTKERIKDWVIGFYGRLMELNNTLIAVKYMLNVMRKAYMPWEQKCHVPHTACHTCDDVNTDRKCEPCDKALLAETNSCEICKGYAEIHERLSYDDKTSTVCQGDSEGKTFTADVLHYGCIVKN